MGCDILRSLIFYLHGIEFDSILYTLSFSTTLLWLSKIGTKFEASPLIFKITHGRLILLFYGDEDNEKLACSRVKPLTYIFTQIASILM